jgi:hypothetical protein
MRLDLGSRAGTGTGSGSGTGSGTGTGIEESFQIDARKSCVKNTKKKQQICSSQTAQIGEIGDEIGSGI